MADSAYITDGEVFSAEVRLRPDACARCNGRGSICTDPGDDWAGRPATFGPCPHCRLGQIVRDGAMRLHLSCVEQTVAAYHGDLESASQAVLALYWKGRPEGARGRALGSVGLRPEGLSPSREDGPVLRAGRAA